MNPLPNTAYRQYFLITGNYWAFTLTDGALRMLVVLYFYDLGYAPLQIALLFLFYELFGVITNLVGGWLGARLGLNTTMNIGLGMQILALTMLLVPASGLTVAWVMTAQALSGIAKDLNKMSAKSAVKLFFPDDAKGTLYKWVAILTGSKNALKGAGFFLGASLLTLLGFRGAIGAMALALVLVWLLSLIFLQRDLGRSKFRPKFSRIFSKSPAVNRLSAARLFLFGARDVWFVVALPVYLGTFGWSHWQIGSFLASWIIGYGLIQSLAPRITRRQAQYLPDGRSIVLWTGMLAVVPSLIVLALNIDNHAAISLVTGLIVFGVVFAITSSLHSYLIVSYADADGVSLDVGFYYMANAMGRLTGTVLSGWVYQTYGFSTCLWTSTLFLMVAVIFSLWLPRHVAHGPATKLP